MNMEKITGNHLIIITFIIAGVILALNDCPYWAAACALGALNTEL